MKTVASNRNYTYSISGGSENENTVSVYYKV